MGGWGSAIDWIFQRLPILTPSQRRRAKIEKLKQELNEIENKAWSPSLAASFIIKQRQLDQLLKDSANQ